MRPEELYKELCEFYPESLRCPWDNDGLMCSAGPREVERILVALDATEEVLIYAAENDFDTVLTHHPMIFEKQRAITPDNNVGRKIIFALMNNISVISLHTRFDAAENGVNDALAEAIGLANVEKFGLPGEVPMGRIGELPYPMSELELRDLVAQKLSSDKMDSKDSMEVDLIKKVAVLGGAGKDLIDAAKAAGADAFVTGEVPYNAMLDAAENGTVIVTAGHYFTEFPGCLTLAKVADRITGAYVEVF